MAVKSLEASFAINVLGAFVPHAMVTRRAGMINVDWNRNSVMLIVWLLLGDFSFLDLGLSGVAMSRLFKFQAADSL